MIDIDETKFRKFLESRKYGYGCISDTLHTVKLLDLTNEEVLSCEEVTELVEKVRGERYRCRNARNKRMCAIIRKLQDFLRSEEMNK